MKIGSWRGLQKKSQWLLFTQRLTGHMLMTWGKVSDKQHKQNKDKNHLHEKISINLKRYLSLTPQIRPDLLCTSNTSLFEVTSKSLVYKEVAVAMW